jgi:predicted HAD superfamily Cof-like phosphohydrolase
MIRDHRWDKEVHDVYDFNHKFELRRPEDPCELPEVTKRKRLQILYEEVKELYEAMESGDFVEQVDALVDIDYVLKGIAVAMGIHPGTWAALWDSVHQSNMKKVRLKKNYNADKPVTKPKGWKAPDVEGILRRNGWRG